MNRFFVSLFLFSFVILVKSCQHETNGYKFDLTPLQGMAGPSGFQAIDSSANPPKYFYYSYCKAITPTNPCKADRTNSYALMTFVNYCNEYGSVNNQIVYGLIDEKDPSIGITIQYTSSTYTCGGAGPATFTIIAQCDPNVDYKMEGLQGPPATCPTYVTVSTKYACPQYTETTAKSGGLSGGSIFLIVLAGVLVAYLIVGIFVQAKFKNESGIRLIPNYEFWSSIPGLVKDGAVWVWGKITRKNGNYTAMK